MYLSYSAVNSALSVQRCLLRAQSKHYAQKNIKGNGLRGDTCYSKGGRETLCVLCLTVGSFTSCTVQRNKFRVIKPKMRRVEPVARMGTYEVHTGFRWRKPSENRSLGRTSRRWKDNIKWMLTTIVWEIVDWLDLAQDRDRCRALVNAVMSLRVPQNAGNFLTS